MAGTYLGVPPFVAEGGVQAEIFYHIKFHKVFWPAFNLVFGPNYIFMLTGKKHLFLTRVANQTGVFVENYFILHTLMDSLV